MEVWLLITIGAFGCRRKGLLVSGAGDLSRKLLLLLLLRYSGLRKLHIGSVRARLFWILPVM